MEIQTYRRRSTGLVVEAEKLSMDNIDKLANWCQGQIVEEGRVDGILGEGLNVKTANGRERLHLGMYLVKSAAGFHTVAASNFETLYEIVEPVQPPARQSRADILPTDNPWGDVPRINP